MLADADYMSRALFLAARGRGRTSPNPMVGAVVVSSDEVVVGYGFHERAGEAHAEVRALRMAGGRARGATLYCTLEPCSHIGRTGPCAVQIVDAGVSRVVAAVEDPNPLVSGQGIAYLRAHGVTVDVGLGAPAATRLNQSFFTLMREKRPFVILKAALSVDGCLSAVPGRPTLLTSAAADRHAHAVRAEVDAIAVGVGTVLSDDPQLTARGAYRERPLVRVVFDRSLRTPPTARLLSTRDAGPVIIVTSEHAVSRPELREPLLRAGAEIEVAPRATLASAIERLGARQIGSLVIEGGAAIHQAAWNEGVADFVQLYLTPHVLGPGALRFLNGRPFDTAGLERRRVEALGPDILVEGYVHRPR